MDHRTTDARIHVPALWRASLSLLAALAVAASCSGPTETGNPPFPDIIFQLDGDGQSAAINHSLATPLRVRVTLFDGTPHAGVAVEWSASSGTIPKTTVTDTAGIATAVWTLGTTPGTQTASAHISGTSGPTRAFTATALALTPMIFRYDGSTWRTELADSSASLKRLNSIWGASPTRAFAVGRCDLFALDSDRWSLVAAPCPEVTDVVSVSGRSDGDVYMITHDALPPSFASTIWHYDGNAFSSSFSRECSSPCRPWLNGVWTSVGAEIFAVGDNGAVIHFDGTSWTPQASGTTVSLHGVWGAAANRVFAVGDVGTILQYDGAAWAQMTSGTTENLYAVWGTSATDVYAVGTHGTLLHYDGGSWSAVNSGTTDDLFAITGTSGRLFAVGANSTVVMYDGSSWSSRQISAGVDLRGIWAAAANAVYAVGGPR